MTFIILIITTLVFVPLIILSYRMMARSIMLLISLSDPKQNVARFDWAVAFVTSYAAMTYRFVVMASVLGSWLLYFLKSDTLASLVSFLPLVNISLFLAGIGWIFGVVKRKRPPT